MFNEAALDELAQDATVFVHSAGLVAAKNQAEFDRINVEGTRMALRAADKAGVETFILLSSLAAGGPVPFGVPPRKEEDPLDPSANYGKSKRGGEIILETEGRSIPRKVILRPGGVYGPYDKAFLVYFRMAWRRFRPILGDGSKIFQPVFASDVAQACVMAQKAPRDKISAYYIVPKKCSTWKSFSAAVEKTVGRKSFSFHIPDWLLQPWILSLWPWERGAADQLKMLKADRWEADPSKAYKELGWSAQTSLEEGLVATWDWYQSQKWI